METERLKERFDGFILHAAPLLPYIAQGVLGAAEAYQRVVKALQDDEISPEEWETAKAARDAVLGRIVKKTEP